MRAALLRLVAEWTLLALVGGGLGWSAAWAVRSGILAERTVLIGFSVLMGAAAAFVLWSARSLDLLPWDDWDDLDKPPDT